MIWQMVDTTDPLGPTRYVASAALGGLVDVRVYRTNCAAWVLGTYANAQVAKAATEAWIAKRAQQRQQTDGDVS